MIEALLQAEALVPGLLQDLQNWRGILIDYEEPHVERLSARMTLPGGPVTAFLHLIHPCAGRPFFHPHPWPSAVKIYRGVYKMDIGYSEPSPLIGFGTSPQQVAALMAKAAEKAPPVAATVWLPAGSTYEMTHRNGWHSVAPEGGPVLSLMVTGPAWERVAYSPGKGTTKALSGPRMGELQQVFLEIFSKSRG